MTTNAEEFFAAESSYLLAEEAIIDEINFILGDPEYDDITFDQHDNSFELLGLEEGFIITEKQREKLCVLGFSQCWISTGRTGVRLGYIHYLFKGPPP